MKRFTLYMPNCLPCTRFTQVTTLDMCLTMALNLHLREYLWCQFV